MDFLNKLDKYSKEELISVYIQKFTELLYSLENIIHDDNEFNVISRLIREYMITVPVKFTDLTGKFLAIYPNQIYNKTTEFFINTDFHDLLKNTQSDTIKIHAIKIIQILQRHWITLNMDE